MIDEFNQRQHWYSCDEPHDASNRSQIVRIQDWLSFHKWLEWAIGKTYFSEGFLPKTWCGTLNQNALNSDQLPIDIIARSELDLILHIFTSVQTATTIDSEIIDNFLVTMSFVHATDLIIFTSYNDNNESMKILTRYDAHLSDKTERIHKQLRLSDSNTRAHSFVYCRTWRTLMVSRDRRSSSVSRCVLISVHRSKVSFRDKLKPNGWSNENRNNKKNRLGTRMVRESSHDVLQWLSLGSNCVFSNSRSRFQIWDFLIFEKLSKAWRHSVLLVFWIDLSK